MHRSAARLLCIKKASEDQARLYADEHSAEASRNQRRPSSIKGCLSDRKASRAIAVVSMCARSADPKTMPFPAFQPPPGHARSRSISVPNRIRSETCCVLQQGNACFSETSETPVGTTQLTVPGNHGHPYLVGSNLTCRSTVRNFQFHSQWPSRPLLLTSQRSALSSRPFDGCAKRRAMTASPVVQHPSGSSPSKAGQLPS